jgi:dienelactone hydrolase
VVSCCVGPGDTMCANRFSGLLRFFFSLAIILPVISAEPCRAEGIRSEMIKIPIEAVPFGGSIVELEALVIRPDDRLPHPLALLNHGSPRLGSDIPLMTPLRMWGPAVAFARRGWVAVAFMRRGYGASQGVRVDTHGACENPSYIPAGEVDAYDIAAAAKYMISEPYVSKVTWISVGVSAGGFATIALTADAPEGLVAAIVFAPGRGSASPDFVCAEDKLIAAFGHYGKTSRIPVLWMAAENDHFFGPQLVKKFTDAFSQAGANVTLEMFPPFDEDGHSLFQTSNGLPIWTPIVDRFLAAHKLTQRDTLIDVRRPNVAPPPSLAANGRESFDRYLDEGPNKAFAIGKNGSYGWAAERRTIDEAREDALGHCAPHSATKCTIANVNNDPAQ